VIENLVRLTPDASRSSKTIARCHDRLATRRRRIEARNRAPKPRPLGAEHLLVAGFCLVYLVAMAGDLLAVAAQR
jgi:hypothetical protein